MGYYAGDYFRPNIRRAGMYRGDPGFFSVLGGLAKKALGFIPGVGPIVSGALDALPKLGRPAMTAIEKVPGASLVKKAGGFIAKHPVLSAAGGAGVLAGAAGGLAGHLLTHGGGGKRHKRMNVCNPRALRRAIRRTHGFAKLAMRTIHLVHPKKKAKFGGFKKRRRSK
jgi:hypothetical protein